MFVRRSAKQKAGDVEHMLLADLTSLYCDFTEPEVRKGLLLIVLHVLQRHGDRLSRGWAHVLEVLGVVVQG